ncbi:MAG: YjbQ family protein [Limnothrix sp. CACIAM 69d]|jgi:secondary thiamine-phosphate synthase enzyme|nr:MAG: YjbQ family protein [Limnothrix sp. CACIAM 69d]
MSRSSASATVISVGAIDQRSQTTHVQQVLRLSTQGKRLHNITSAIAELVARSGVTTGLCTLFVQHTSASLVIQENADSDVLQDLETFLAGLVPESAPYQHSAEGPDDMPAHIRTALTHTSEQIPIVHGQLGLGIWQGIYLWEHRQHGRTREVVVHIMGG